MSTCYENYRTIIKIRVFEESILELFSQNKLSGTTHTYIGEEATAVAVMNHVKPQDTVFSNHRCHGHYLAYGGPERLLLAEIMSKESGLCQGRGGSQHIRYKNFFTNGIQGGIVPNAVGVAMANKIQNVDANTLVFLGDGTLGQGVVYEALNIASVYDIPVVFIIEDNQYAMSTKRTDVIAGDIKKRIEGFGIKTFDITSTDVDELDVFFGLVFNYINSERKPVCAVVHNYRLGAHSKGDDTRDEQEVAMYRKNDPFILTCEKLGKDISGRIIKQEKENIEAITTELENEKSIEIDALPLHEQRYTDISFVSREETRYIERIRDAFAEELSKNKNAVIYGEDVRDPYGGPFKATKGLSTAYSSQVFNMPISEACMVGMAVGLAMNKCLPIVEMMFGDFITLGFDQLLNHASKYTWVYGNDIQIPMIIRVPSGAKRGYGPTHSQSLEKFLIGIPKIRVLALSQAIDPKVFYEMVFSIIAEPIVIIENKKMYSQKTWSIVNNRYKDYYIKEINNYGYPTIVFSIDPDEKADIYAITYGGMVEETLLAATDLMVKEEIHVDVIVLTQLSPLPILDLKECLSEKARIVIIEEGTKTAGIGAEILAQCVETSLGKEFFRIATPDIPIPNGMALESQIIPDKNRIIEEIRVFYHKN